MHTFCCFGNSNATPPKKQDKPRPLQNIYKKPSHLRLAPPADRPVVSFHWKVHQEHRSRLRAPKSPGSFEFFAVSEIFGGPDKKSGFNQNHIPVLNEFVINNKWFDITYFTMHPWIYRMLAWNTTRIRHETGLGSRESQLLNLWFGDVARERVDPKLLKEPSSRFRKSIHGMFVIAFRQRHDASKSVFLRFTWK